MVKNVKDVLIQCICDKTDYPVNEIKDSMTLESDLGLDSITKVELLSTVSEQFNINLEEMDEEDSEKLEKAQTVGELVIFVEAMISKLSA